MYPAICYHLDAVRAVFESITENIKICCVNQPQADVIRCMKIIISDDSVFAITRTAGSKIMKDNVSKPPPVPPKPYEPLYISLS